MGKKAYDLRLDIRISLKLILMAESEKDALHAATTVARKYFPERSNQTGDGILLSESGQGELLSHTSRKLTNCDTTKKSRSSSTSKSKAR